MQSDGTIHPWVERRFDRALELSEDAPIVCLSAGTVHRPPPLNLEGFPVLESVAGAEYLLSKGVPASRIQVEALSHDTIGNAYFTKLVHVDPPGWKRIVAITSEFHMTRSRAIFEWVFGLEAGKYELSFEATENVGVAPELLSRRLEKEEAGLVLLRRHIERIRDLPSLHRWMFSEHGAYTAQGWTNRRSSARDVVEIY